MKGNYELLIEGEKILNHAQTRLVYWFNESGRTDREVLDEALNGCQAAFNKLLDAYNEECKREWISSEMPNFITGLGRKACVDPDGTHRFRGNIIINISDEGLQAMKGTLNK